MSDYYYRSSSRLQVRWLWVVLLAVVLVATGAATVWGLTRPLSFTVDGVTQTLPARSTVADVQAANMLKATPGSLLSVKGKVIRVSGGDPPVIKRNGEPVEPSQRLYEGDEIVSLAGANKTEKSMTATETIPIATQNEGSGPVLKVTQPGVAGVAEVTKGAISGVKVSNKIIKQGQPMVVTHSRPTAGDKLVALTFDDGPWPGQTEKILDILAQKQVKATFFMLGGRVKQAPTLAKRVHDEGHLIGNHSLSHPDLTKLKPADIRHQITAGAGAIERATGVAPVWFRPPYGAVNSKVLQQTRVLKVRVALWDIDTLDWKKPGVPRLIRNVLKPIKPGAVILMHDGGVDRSQTIAALPQVIDKLRAQGYSFVTLDELAAAK